MCSNSELDACGEDMIPLSFTAVSQARWEAQIMPNQSVKASYASDSNIWNYAIITLIHLCLGDYYIIPLDCLSTEESYHCMSYNLTLAHNLHARYHVACIITCKFSITCKLIE